MALPTKPTEDTGDLLLIKLAREIAIDHSAIEDILERYQIQAEQWDSIRASERFQSLLTSELAAWHSALNTEERTKLKAAAMIEEYLPEANSRLHDKSENLPAKVELAKLVARIAGMGLTGAGVEGGKGERFSVTINLGSDSNLKFEKEAPAINITPHPVE